MLSLGAVGLRSSSGEVVSAEDSYLAVEPDEQRVLADWLGLVNSEAGESNLSCYSQTLSANCHGSTRWHVARVHGSHSGDDDESTSAGAHAKNESNKMDAALSRAGSLVIIVDAAPFLHWRAISPSLARSTAPHSHYRRRYGWPWQYINKILPTLLFIWSKRSRTVLRALRWLQKLILKSSGYITDW